MKENIRIVVMTSMLFCLVACGGPADNKTKVSEQDNEEQAVTEKETGAAPKIMTEATLDLTKYGIANNASNVLGGLKVGDVAPDFTLTSQYGKSFTLDERLNQGPVLLVFFRADWCGYCNNHLEEFQDNIRAVSEAGHASVLAVSPQLPSYSQELYTKYMLSFPILYDKDHSVMKKYKVFFHVTDAYNDKIKDYKGKSIEEMNGNAEPVMPVPATYLIGQDKKIKYVHYDPDYAKRASVPEVIAKI